WSVAQPLRLPGMINLPNAKKRKRGRVPAPTLLIEFNERRYEGWEFDLAEPNSATKVDIEFDVAEEVVDFDTLAAEYNFDDDLRTIIRDGRLEKPKSGDDSRSAWAFDGILRLLRRNVPHPIIKGLLLGPGFGISQHILSARHTPEDQEKYAERQIRNAL